MRPVAVAVLQPDARADPGAALATMEEARRYVARPAGLAAPVPAGAESLTVVALDRAVVAAAVGRACPDAVVVVLAPDERITPELAGALCRLAAEAPRPARYAARVRLRFLGEEIEVGREVIAWTEGGAGASEAAELAAPLLRIGADVTTTIARLDEVATAAARERRGAGDVVDLLWRPAWRLARRVWARRRHGGAGAILSVLETYGEVLTAAKAWERATTAAAALRAPVGFRRIESPSGFVLLRHGTQARLERIVLGAAPDEVEGEPLDGRGRGATWVVVDADGSRAILRWYRRGGAARRVVRDRYCGWRLRPVRELAVTEEARRRGVLAPAVLALRVDRLPFGCHRGALVTREIGGAVPLGDVLGRDLGAAARAALLRAVGRTVRQLHECGVHHRDLNAGNLLVTGDEAEPRVWVIDFDRASLRARMSGRVRRGALRRLGRSLAKRPGVGVVPPTDDQAGIERAYWTT